MAVLLDRDGDGRFETVEEEIVALGHGAWQPPSFRFPPMAGDRTVVVRGSFRAEVLVRDAAGDALGRATMPFDRQIAIPLSRALAPAEPISLADSMGRSMGAEVVTPRPTLFRQDEYYLDPTGGTITLYGRGWDKETRAELDGRPLPVEWVDAFRLRVQAPAGQARTLGSHRAVLTGPGLKEPLEVRFDYWSR